MKIKERNTMNASLEFLSKKDTIYIKGFAILLIVFHNFFHLLEPVFCRENEFVFNAGNYQALLNEFSFSESINIFFSFFGYIGIYIFFFLSGYGLTKKMMKKSDGLYAAKRILKLEKLLLLGIVFYFFINKGNVDYGQIFSKLTLTDNFSLKRVSQISPSWWFLACLAQLYLLFYPLYKLIKKYPSSFFIILYLYIMLAYGWIASPYNEEYMYRNCIGHIPEFCLGIYLALYEQKYQLLHSRKTQLMLFILSLIFLVLAQTSSFTWILSGLICVTLIVSLFKLFPHIFQNRFIYYTGIISAYIYILHTDIFRFFFINIAQNTSPSEKLFWCFLWFCIVYATCSTIYIFRKCFSNLIDRIS